MNEKIISKIASEYGTPFYLFDIDRLFSWSDEVHSVFPDGVTLCYAIKANPFLLKYFNRTLPFFEVCSPGEYSICEKYNIPSEKIIFSGVVKYKENIEAVLKNEFLGTITLESKKHFSLLKEVVLEKGITHIKVLPRLSSGNKFGMSKEDIFEIVSECSESEIFEVTGIQYFSGTQKKRISVIEKELAELDLFIQEIYEKTGVSLGFIEYGPGMLFDYYDGNKGERINVAKEVAELIKPYTSKYKFTLEIGRYFAAVCGSYVTKVVDIKSTFDKNYCLVDGGIHHVNYYGRMLGMNVPDVVHFKAEGDSYRAGKQIKAADKAGVAEGDAPDGEQSSCNADNGYELWEVCGALCTVNDVLLRNHPANDLNEGDLLVFNDTGAYSSTESSVLFLSRTMPRIFSVENNEITMLRDFVETFDFNS